MSAFVQRRLQPQRLKWGRLLTGTLGVASGLSGVGYKSDKADLDRR